MVDDGHDLKETTVKSSDDGMVNDSELQSQSSPG